MFKLILSSLTFAVVLSVAPLTAKAQTIDLAEALQRMNSIIAEMEKLRTEFSALANSVGSQHTSPSVLGAQADAIFTMPLVFGETNDDIKRIQKLLATDPEIYPYGVASGFFGPKTEEAIKNLQARNGWDTPGVVGPSTKALLEDYFRAYPDENWPTDVLKSKPPAPQVQGASVTTTGTVTSYTPQSTVSGTNLAREINVTFDDSEALIEIIYTNGNRKGLIADTTNKDQVVAYIVGHTVLTTAMVLEVIDYSGRSSNSSSDDVDEGDAEDALDDADEAIDDADDEIDEADEDGDDVDWAEDTLREAKDLFDEAEEAFEDEDYEDAVDLAKDAERMAKKAEDRIDEKKSGGSGDAEDIDEIKVKVKDGESRVIVEYDDGDDYKFDVEEDDEEDIISEIADELDMDEEDVEDLVEFDYGDIDRIEVRIDSDSSLVRIFYETGLERRIRTDETDENDIIDEVADELDMDDDEIEDIIDFD